MLAVAVVPWQYRELFDAFLQEQRGYKIWDFFLDFVSVVGYVGQSSVA